MIHVDVHRAGPEGDHAILFGIEGYAIDVSVDGARFVKHWSLPARGSNELESDLAAKSDARMYAAGIKFGGGDVRLTAFGEEVHVPDMSTVHV